MDTFIFLMILKLYSKIEVDTRRFFTPNPAYMHVECELIINSTCLFTHLRQRN